MTYQHERKAPKDEPSRSSDVNESKAESLEVPFFVLTYFCIMFLVQSEYDT